MSISIICAVKDSAVDSYDRPFFVPTVSAAVRMFGDEITNPESPLAKHPNDYTLYKLGAFDADSGEFETHRPEQIARGADYVNAAVSRVIKEPK